MARPGLLAALVAVILPSAALGDAVVVRSQSWAELYTLRAWRTGWDDQTRVARQRLVQALSIQGNDLLADQDLDLFVSLRLGLDLGWRPGEPEALDGVERWLSELLVGGLRWRSRDRSLELAAGRLLRVGPIDFRYVDGIEAAWRVGSLRLEGFGGLLVKDGSLLGSPTFEPDGVRSSDAALAGRVADDWPFGLSEFHDAPSLIYGLEATLRPLRPLTLRAGWQQARSAGALDLDRITAGVEAEHGCLSLESRLEWDLFGARPTWVEARAGCGLPLGPWVGAEYLRVVPTFDADSIWNVFALGPMEEAALLARWRPAAGWSLSLRPRARRYTDPELGEGDLALGGELAASHAAGPRRRLSLRAAYLGGYGGTQAWLQGAAAAALGERFTATLELAAGWVDDPTLAQLRTPVLGARAGVVYAFDRSARILLWIEDAVTRFLSHDLRALLLLDLEATF